MKIQEFLEKYREYFKNETRWSFWTKRIGPMHLPNPYSCDVPKLGNNYSGWGFEDNRDICPKCLHTFFTNISEENIQPEDKKYLTSGGFHALLVIGIDGEGKPILCRYLE